MLHGYASRLAKALAAAFRPRGCAAESAWWERAPLTRAYAYAWAAPTPLRSSGWRGRVLARLEAAASVARAHAPSAHLAAACNGAPALLSPLAAATLRQRAPAAVVADVPRGEQQHMAAPWPAVEPLVQYARLAPGGRGERPPRGGAGPGLASCGSGGGGGGRHLPAAADADAAAFAALGAYASLGAGGTRRTRALPAAVHGGGSRGASEGAVTDALRMYALLPMGA